MRYILPIIPNAKIIKLKNINKNIVVAVNPFGINNKASLDIIPNIDKILIEKIKIENKTENIELIRPTIKIILNGKIENEISPSNPNKKEPKN